MHVAPAQPPSGGLDVEEIPEGSEVFRERYRGALERAASLTRTVGRAVTRLNSRIERYRGGWSLWDAYDLDATPSCEATPIGIEVALRRMPFVGRVLVDRPLEHGNGWLDVRVLLRPWARALNARWCEAEIRRAVAQRQAYGLQIRVTVE